jgi:hypothetical protein
LPDPETILRRVDLSASTAGHRLLLIVVVMALKVPRHSLLLLLAVGAVQAAAASAAVPPPQAQLQVSFYARSCPRAEAIVRRVVRRRAARDRSVLPALIRLHFHDCFVRVRTRRRTSKRPCAIGAATMSKRFRRL